MKKEDTIKAAFFDVDGTILRGAVLAKFPKYLVNLGMISTDALERTSRIMREVWKSYNSYRSICEFCWVLFGMNIRGLRREDIVIAAKSFMKDFIRDAQFSYTIPLLSKMRSLVDIMVAVGGPIQECMNELKILGFDEVHGTIFEVHGGIYTGRTVRNGPIAEYKENVINELTLKFNIDLKRSFGFGDRDQDEPILRNVGFPIALNPGAALKAICVERGWPIFTEQNPPALEMFQNLLNNQ